LQYFSNKSHCLELVVASAARAEELANEIPLAQIHAAVNALPVTLLPRRLINAMPFNPQVMRALAGKI
jgi:hypothetical protein